MVTGGGEEGARALDTGRGTESRVPLFRRCGLARDLDASRARWARGAHRARSLARALEADQSAVVSRARPRPADLARLRAVRPDVSDRSFRGSGPRVPRDEDRP